MSPRDFWALSFREWRALCGASVPPTLGRRELDALIARYPD